MTFRDKLKTLMKGLGINQKQVAELTGLSRSTISEYLSTPKEPKLERQRQIAKALGVQPDYFESLIPTVKAQTCGVYNLPITKAAKLLGKSKEFVEQGLKDGVFPWGYAVKLQKWSYYISSAKFMDYTGIQITE